MTILEDLYYVDICPWERLVKKESGEQKSEQLMVTNEKKLRATLTEQQKDKEVVSEPTTSSERKPTTPPKTETTIMETQKPTETTSLAVNGTHTANEARFIPKRINTRLVF